MRAAATRTLKPQQRRDPKRTTLGAEPVAPINLLLNGQNKFALILAVLAVRKAATKQLPFAC